MAAQRKPYRFIHKIEFWRESGDPADPDSESQEVLVGTCLADRRDVRSREKTAQVGTYFRTQTLYTVRASVWTTLTPAAGDDDPNTFGESRLGVDPMGIPEASPQVLFGNEPQLDWIVRDSGRPKQRYRITGRKKSDDMRYWELNTEEVR